MTKKYLKQQKIKNYIRVVALNKGSYVLKYIQTASEDKEEAE